MATSMSSSFSQKVSSIKCILGRPNSFASSRNSKQSTSDLSDKSSREGSQGPRLSITESSARSSSYIPPKVWSLDAVTDKASMGSNLPTAGARHDSVIHRGKHRIQLYSMATPNGQKVTILLEELLALGYKRAEYDAWLVNILKDDQFGSDFVNKVNPNSKIPALLDYSHKSSKRARGEAYPTRIFESSSILLYLSEQFDHSFCPPHLRHQVLNWLFWQTGAAPFVGGGFGHFVVFAKEKHEYPINRFTTETKRQLHVLEQELADQQYICGEEYTLADMAIFAWYGQLILGDVYGASVQEFLNVESEYPHVLAWARRIQRRPAVQRGCIVNKFWGDGPKLNERHSSHDITQALLEASGGRIGEQGSI